MSLIYGAYRPLQITNANAVLLSSVQTKQRGRNLYLYYICCIRAGVFSEMQISNGERFIAPRFFCSPLKSRCYQFMDGASHLHIIHFYKKIRAMATNFYLE